MAVKVNTRVVWVVIPYCLVECYQSIGRICCAYLQDWRWLYQAPRRRLYQCTNHMLWTPQVLSLESSRIWLTAGFHTVYWIFYNL